MDWKILPFEMSREFKSSASGAQAQVHLNSFCILSPQSPVTHLTTFHTNVCAGIALLPDDPQGNIGMMHVFSDARHSSAGQGAVTRHVIRGWDKFIAALNPVTSYTAVTFGGRNDIDPEYACAMQASMWTNNTIGHCIASTDFIHRHENFCYQNGPHYAILCRELRQIAIGNEEYRVLTRENTGSLKHIPYQTERIFNSLEIT